LPKIASIVTVLNPQLEFNYRLLCWFYKPFQNNHRTARRQLGLKHREMNHAVFDLATREASASDTLELGPVFMEIAEGLVLRPKRRLEMANLPNRANRERKRNDLHLV
jgi:hypothetical protein